MTKFNRNSIVAIAVASFVFGITGPFVALAATDPGLGAATSFSVLGQTGITGTGTISGNVENNGTGAAITALTTAMVAGTIYSSDGGFTTGAPPAATTLLNPAVQADALAAYTTNIPGQGTNGTIVGALDGQTFTPGVYDQGAILLGGGTVTLNGAGIYIFRSASTLTSAGTINLIGGARACDVFWRVQTNAAINGTSFVGTILSGTTIAFGANVTLDGRALGVGPAAAVTMINDTISGPSCPLPPPPAPVSVPVDTGGVYSMSWVTPLINVLKVPTPLALPFGPGSVTYDYTVSNFGTIPMSNVTITDNKCTNVSFISGDTNNDLKLDVNEIWKYSCTTILSQTTTNIVTVTGRSINGLTASDTAEATVVVGLSTPPLIHLVKIPSVFSLLPGGGAVTYMYTVTNPGTAPLSDVTITDDKCTGLPGRVVGHPGDLNKNNLLESNEVWSFTCQTNITNTTTNIGTARGSANGFTATDFSSATVVVGQVLGVTAGFPNTGFPPQDNNKTPWNIIISTGILIALFSAYSIRKKQVI